MTGWYAFLIGVGAGIAGGLALGFAIGRRLPPAPARKVATMRHRIGEFVRRHIYGIVAVLLALMFFGYLALAYAATQAHTAAEHAADAQNRAVEATQRLAGYTRCVAQYLSDLGTAQSPRSQASVAVTDANHALIRDTRRYGGNSPQAVRDEGQYLVKWHLYQQAVKDNPLPTLPGCLTVPPPTGDPQR